ncbi:MAG: stage 0 sporulation family protein [bacterium]|nr:stage 0 sporulation family protein [bacterium]
MLKVAGIKFKDWGKIYTFDTQGIELKKMDKVIVESENGLCFGSVKIPPYEPEQNAARKDLKKVIRIATDEDLMQLARNKEKETDAFIQCRDTITKMKLDMKLVNVEYMFDGSKALFYFTAEERVDFRELVKNLAGQVHTRIEMRQIGVRDEAKKKGGIGPCGRILCCTTWIDSFGPVSVKMAKVQGLSLNPANISGMCGRLMCCLAFEHKNYIDGFMPKKPSAPPQEDMQNDRPPARENRPGERRPERRPERQSDNKSVRKSDRRPDRPQRKRPQQAADAAPPDETKKTESIAGNHKEGVKGTRKPRPRRRKRKVGAKKSNEQ